MTWTMINGEAQAYIGLWGPSRKRLRSPDYTAAMVKAFAITTCGLRCTAGN